MGLRAGAGRIAGTLALAGAASGCCCGIEQPVVCGTSLGYGITVVVRDSVTGQAAAQGALAVARDGTYADTLRIIEGASGPPLMLGGVRSRTGTYTVRIEKPGYRPWDARDVNVYSGECGIQTTARTANLAPAT